MKNTIKIFCDGADQESFRKLADKKYVQGYTTNPTLMRQAKVENYSKFAKEVLKIIGNKPISFEVFADDEARMAKQALIINKWGKNVYVKIPVVNSKGESMLNLIKSLHSDGVSLNITAILAEEQLEALAQVLSKRTPSVVSIFAGRIADTGRDPAPTIQKANKLFAFNESVEILWASTREVFNIFQAEKAGAHIITVPPELLLKYEKLNGLDLLEFSRQTSEMFWKDAQKAGYQLN